MATKQNKQKMSKRTKQKRKILLFSVELVCLVIVIGCVYVASVLGGWMDQIDWDDKFSSSQAGINEDINSQTVEKMAGYTNIALFGLDNRSVGNYKWGNSDTIMIASINNDTKEVKLVSVYRDTYLSIGEGKYNKANSAYNLGGVERAVKMLNANLDLSITDYVCVDWAALIQAIDALGGIELEVTSQEVFYINGYLDEIDRVLEISTPRVSSAGRVHLTGAQATAYARIRYTTGHDFLRTSRQRIILEKMLNKAKNSDLATLTSVCNAVFDDISTSLSMSEIIGLAKDVTKYSIKETTGFPTKLTGGDLADAGDAMIPIDLSENVKQLHLFLFENEDYVPSKTVEAIDQSIINKTGVTEDTPSYETDKYNNSAGADGTQFKDKN